MDTIYECKCGWTGREDETRSECTFAETRLEPAEYVGYCPDCGANWEDMSEAVYCYGCEDVIVQHEGELCSECETENVEQQYDRWREEHHC